MAINISNYRVENIIFYKAIIAVLNQDVKAYIRNLSLLSSDYKNKLLHSFNYSTLSPLLYFNKEEYLVDYYDNQTIQALRNNSYVWIKKTFINLGFIKIFARYLNANNIDYFFLKGIYFNLLNRNKIGLRPISDIDILINFNHINQVVEFLISKGFYFEDTLILNKNSWKGCKYKYNSIPALVNDYGIKIEIHHSFFYSEHEEMWGHQKINFKNYTSEQLDDVLIKFPDIHSYTKHLIYHGTQQGNFCSGFKFLYDLIELERANKIDLLKFFRESDSTDNEYIKLCEDIVINEFSDESFYGKYELIFKQNLKVDSLKVNNFFSLRKFNENIKLFFNHSNEEISYRLNIDKESTNGVTVTILFF